MIGIRRSPEERERILAAWKSSGLAMRVFAKREGISASTMYGWVAPRRAREGATRLARVVRGAGDPFSFNVSGTVAVTLQRGPTRIWVTTGCDRATLATVISVLDAASSKA